MGASSWRKGSIDLSGEVEIRLRDMLCDTIKFGSGPSAEQFALFTASLNTLWSK